MTSEELCALPLWRLLEIGLADLKKHEETPDCKVTMSTWLVTMIPKEGEPETCFACLAGAVLRHSFGARQYSERCLGQQLIGMTLWTAALNQLRTGDVSEALNELNRQSKPGLQFNRHIPHYGDGKDIWWQHITALQRELKAAGI